MDILWTGFFMIRMFQIITSCSGIEIFTFMRNVAYNRKLNDFNTSTPGVHF